MAKPAIVSIRLDPKLRRFAERRVKAGKFKSLDEALDAGLRALRERDALRRETIEWLRHEIAIGVAEADRGELLDADEVFAEIRAKSAQRRRAQT